MDPFGLRPHATNSALSKQHTLAADIYEHLFDRIFFKSKEYASWSQGDRPWSLNIYGAPGCGKTTLAVITIQRLRANESDFRVKAAPVASIFIEKDVSTSVAVFLEDFLYCIHHQLPSAGTESDDRFELYETACQNGESISKRVALLRTSLYSRLDDHDYTFLVFDGYDRISEGLQVLLDREFADLRVHRLRVLQTRRVPAHELPLWMGCDGPDCEEYRLKLYWACKKCYKNEEDCYVLCYTCKEQGTTCPIHGAAYLEEIYDHVDIDVSCPDDIESYVAWDLHRAYGDLQTHQTPKEATMQPESSTEIISNENDAATTLTATTERLRKVIQSISDMRNITIAKLYLDNIHSHQSLEVVEKVGDRLPRNIIALFDAGIEHIRQQPRHQSDIALMAIAAAAEKERGIPLVMLEDWMRDTISRLPHLASAPPRSLEDILRCANGFIAESDSGDRRVNTYSPLLTLYVRENYNEKIFWARGQLTSRRISKSLTGLVPTQPKLTSPPMVASPPTMGYSPDEIDEGPGKPPLGSTPEYFNRSFASGGFPFPPKKPSSLRQHPGSVDSDLGIKKFGISNRSYTMLPSTTRKKNSRNDIFEIQEESAPREHHQSRPSRSINNPSSRICPFCELIIFSPGNLSGKYHRLYSHLEPAMAKRCMFCSTLYKDFLKISKVDRANLKDAESPLYHWTIRSTAKSRESKNSIIVSFHSSQQEKRHTGDTPQLALPVGDTKSGKPSSPPNRHPTHRFHILSEDDIGPIPTKDEFASTTDPFSKTGRQIKKWLHDCNQNHTSCIKAAKTTWVPTRLLDLQFGDLSSVRLIKTASENIRGPYVTLSHCWGPKTKENEFIVTLGETEEVYKTKGIKVSALSTNFQQAISVARFIGIRYIWIDSLCIIQGPASDFHSEGQLMHKVYRNSYCNFAAADSVDSRGGLFRKRNPADVLPGRYKGNGESAVFGTTNWRVVREDVWERELLESSIYTRGWVFQERMLAPRVLHFTHTQIFWDCGTLSACETLPSGLPLSLDDAASTDRHWRGRLQESSSLAHAPLSGANDDSLEGFWSSSVLRYTKCNLTSQYDKSVAIWSIAKLVRDAWADEYGAGIWGAALEEQLSWKVVNMAKSIRNVDLQWKQPSWSWTSVQGAVSLPERVMADRCYRVKGHDGEAISFKAKGATRPGVEREHSDSFKEDLELGWGEWQRKTMARTHSSPSVRKDISQERSQSMPTVQNPITKPTVAESKKEKPAVTVDPRDMEPELETKSIAVHAPIGSGSLHHNNDTGTYTFTVASNAESTTLQPTPPNPVITFEAHLDERPTPLDLHPNSLHFLILTATSHTTHSGLGIHFSGDDFDSDNEPDLPVQTTYSGTGILLIPSEEYLRRGDFGVKIVEAQKKLDKYLVEKGTLKKGSNEEWAAKVMEEEIKALRGLVEQLQKWNGTEEEGRHFRRMGVVTFEGWSEGMYGEFMGWEGVKVWLD